MQRHGIVGRFYKIPPSKWRDEFLELWQRKAALQNDATPDFAHAPDAAQRHAGVEFLMDDFQRLGNTGFAHRVQAKFEGTADQCACRQATRGAKMDKNSTLRILGKN